MALVKILKVGETIDIGGLVSVTVASLEREKIGLIFNPSGGRYPKSGLYEKKDRIVVIPDCATMVVYTKPSQVSSAVLAIDAPREIKISQIDKE